jgi:hypothetical protein
VIVLQAAVRGAADPVIRLEGQQPPGDDLLARLLVDLAQQARRRFLAGVETAARQVPGPGCPGEPRHNRAQQAPLRQHDAVGPDPLADQWHLIGPRLLVDHHPVDGRGVSG